MDAKLFSFNFLSTGFTCQPLGSNTTNPRLQHWCEPKASDFRPNSAWIGRCGSLPRQTCKHIIFYTLDNLFQTFHFLFQNLNADLQKFVNLNDLPELLLSVCYNATLQRLTVNVVEGKNFKVKCFMLVSVLKSPCWYLRIYLAQKKCTGWL